MQHPRAESLGDMRQRVPSSKREATLRCCWQKPTQLSVMK